jgi:hypothetical protein
MEEGSACTAHTHRSAALPVVVAAPHQRGSLTADVQERYDATLFRFPLRDATAAAMSDIKSTPTSTDDVESLFEALRSGEGSGPKLVCRQHALVHAAASTL